MLTGWIFGLLPRGEEHYEQAKRLVVETICGGLDAPGGRRVVLNGEPTGRTGRAGRVVSEQ